MKQLLFTGAATALVTPFKSNGKIDLEKYSELIEFQISEGIDAIVAVGTTGENAVLSGEEHRALMKCAVETARGRVPVICSTGSNDTEYCIGTTQAAEEAGADGLLLVTPYYNKCTQSGLIKHYERILSKTKLPAIVYNVPSRTGFNIGIGTYKELAKHPQIVGTKEASGNMALAMEIRAQCGDDMPLYSGNDDLTVPMMAIGGRGVISVLSNILPNLTHDMCKLCLDKDFDKASELAFKYLDLTNALFSEVNPIPVKAAMNMMGLDVGGCRLPLCEMGDENKEKLRQILAKHGLV
ncbi:MAG: 4-hydroxy-tetrahydrodipicolinate synthase [Ruminococcus sp.]|nr:4-hydroxy-tetrahydrodipicolinate synthase [Ruminococcus sp.]